VPPTGAVRVLRVHLRECDERPTVERPTLEARKLCERASVHKNRATSNELGPQPPEQEWQIAIAPRPLEEQSGVGLQFDQLANRFEGITKEKARPLGSAEQVRDHREGRPLDP